MMERIPVKKAHTANVAAISMGIVNVRLLKNVSPPLCPEATKTKKNAKNNIDIPISLIDQLPRVVFGL